MFFDADSVLKMVGGTKEVKVLKNSAGYIHRTKSHTVSVQLSGSFTAGKKAEVCVLLFNMCPTYLLRGEVGGRGCVCSE